MTDIASFEIYKSIKNHIEKEIYSDPKTEGVDVFMGLAFVVADFIKNEMGHKNKDKQPEMFKDLVTKTINAGFEEIFNDRNSIIA